MNSEMAYLLCCCKFNSCILLLQVLGPLAGNILFTEDDFKLLENFDMDLYARKVRNQVCQDQSIAETGFFL